MKLYRKSFTDIFTKLGKKPLEIWFSGKEGAGEFKLWYSDGQLLKHCFFNEKGEIDGELKAWDHNGNLITHNIYKNGKYVRYIE